MPKATKPGFYAVKVGRQTGIFLTWNECEAQIKGYPLARYRKFDNATDAEIFLSSGVTPSSSPVKTKNKGKNRAPDSDDSDESDFVVVYSDGACKGNGGTGPSAGIGCWWGENDPRNISERCPGEQTNNRAELIAIIRVLETAPQTKKPLMIKTDSQYSMACMSDRYTGTNSWLEGWKKNNWQTTAGQFVKNVSIIKYLDALLIARSKAGQEVRLTYVKGHSGNIGNDGADALATRGAFEPTLPDRDWQRALAVLSSNPSGGSAQGQVAGIPPAVKDDVFTEEVSNPSNVKKGNETELSPLLALPDTTSMSPLVKSTTSSICTPSYPLSRTPVRQARQSKGVQVSLQEESGHPDTETLSRTPSRKCPERSFPTYPRDPETPTRSRFPQAVHTPTSASRRIRSRIPGGLEDVIESPRQIRLLGSTKAQTRALSLYPLLEEEITAPSYPNSPTPRSPSNGKSTKQIDLTLTNEFVTSPRDASKSSKLVNFPFTAETFAQSNNPVQNSPTLVSIAQVTNADINLEEYADCLADEEELLKDLEEV